MSSGCQLLTGERLGGLRKAAGEGPPSATSINYPKGSRLDPPPHSPVSAGAGYGLQVPASGP